MKGNSTLEITYVLTFTFTLPIAPARTNAHARTSNAGGWRAATGRLRAMGARGSSVWGRGVSGGDVDHCRPCPRHCEGDCSDTGVRGRGAVEVMGETWAGTGVSEVCSSIPGKYLTNFCAANLNFFANILRNQKLEKEISFCAFLCKFQFLRNYLSKRNFAFFLAFCITHFLSTPDDALHEWMLLDGYC